jgi:hypothetical protein|tara:strand:- start:4682 stop:5218 length:537 start_codon:yes stop_codon:yes gene_type:complete
MKGIVFTEFNEMVEARFSPAILDELISECALPSGGAYTTVGTYDHEELMIMTSKLAEKVNITQDDLMFSFGEHLAVRFAVLFPTFFSDFDNMFEFMKTLDNHIHIEVKKLYPDATLPKFSFDDTDPSCLVMDYRSSRGLSTLAYGLMRGVSKHYNEDIIIELEYITGKNHVRFYLTKP